MSGRRRAGRQGSAGPPGGWISKERDRKSTRLNSSHSQISYAVFCLKKKKKKYNTTTYITTNSRNTRYIITPCSCILRRSRWNLVLGSTTASSCFFHRHQ